MKSGTLISKQLKKKKNPKLAETILLAKKNAFWKEIAGSLSGPRKNMRNLNLDKLNEKIKEEKNVVVPGKVLSQGKIDKKVKIIALSFSKKAEGKLKSTGCDIKTILEEIKSNPSGRGVKILK